MSRTTFANYSICVGEIFVGCPSYALNDVNKSRDMKQFFFVLAKSTDMNACFQNFNFVNPKYFRLYAMLNDVAGVFIW